MTMTTMTTKEVGPRVVDFLTCVQRLGCTADATVEPGDGFTKRPRHNDVPGGFTYVDKDGESGRRKIRIEYIGDKSRRHITFSKRKAGIMKKVRPRRSIGL